MQCGVDVQNRDEKMWITVVKGNVPFGPMFDAPSPQSTSSSNRPRDLVRAGVPAIPGAKIQPQAKELEEVVLGAMMVEKSAVNAVIDVLQPESFYVEAFGEVFRAIQTLFNNSEPIDLLTVTEQLRKDGKLDMLGGSHRVASLTSRVASSANVEFHARIIAQKHIQRELIRVSNAIIEKAYDETSDVFDLLDEAESKLFEVAEGNIRKSYESMSTVMRQALDDIEAARNNEDGVSGVPSGFHDLDKITGGWQRSDMIVLAARPGMGKTAFVLSMARNMAVDHDIPVAVFSLEMSAVQLVQRLISSETEINSDKFRKGNLEEHEYQQLHSRCGKLSKAPLFIDDTPGLNIFELRAKCRRLKAQHGIDMVIIDYLQLMSAGSDKGNREQEISSISRSIKGIAKELDVPIIALSQLSRNVETRGGDKRPLLSDLRESGAIEQDADIVAFIYRAEYYGITEHPDGIDTAGLGELILAKHRHGALDTIKMKFVKNLAKFANYDTFGDLGLGGGAMQPNAAFGAPVTKTLPSKMNDDPISGGDAPF
jgi:replicative DNA helicase